MLKKYIGILKSDQKSLAKMSLFLTKLIRECKQFQQGNVNGQYDLFFLLKKNFKEILSVINTQHIKKCFMTE